MVILVMVVTVAMDTVAMDTAVMVADMVMEDVPELSSLKKLSSIVVADSMDKRSFKDF